MAWAAQIGADLDLFQLGRHALTLGAHAMIVPNVYGTRLWVVPITAGFRY